MVLARATDNEENIKRMNEMAKMHEEADAS
jgi:hypothetical protein